jgi:hypothetical protein
MGRVFITSLLLLHTLIYLLGPSRSKPKSNRNFIFTTYMNDGPFEPWEGI